LSLEHSKDEKLNQNKKAEQFWEALGEKVFYFILFLGLIFIV
jgi:hypothetical protein